LEELGRVDVVFCCCLIVDRPVVNALTGQPR
jgi:hypothetical protein